MPTWIAAAFWGFVAGSALLVGAAFGYFATVPQRVIAAIMAFGGGVLISALSFDLMEEAYNRGGFGSTAIGFIGGAAVYTLADWYLARRGAKHRKRSQDQQPTESIVIGVTMISGGAVSWVAVGAIFLSNVPEGLSSSSGMRRAGRSAAYVFGLWTVIVVISSASALAGYAIFSRFSAGVIAATTAVAAGAILSMLADTMIPEAFESAHDFTGLITVGGFLTAFVLSKSSG